MEPSVFTKVINGDLPSHKVYEDDHTFAFMDIAPVQPGMVVIVPKVQVGNLEDLPTEYLHGMIDAAQKIMLAERKVFPERKKISLQVEGLDMPNHAHVKIMPIDSGEDFRTEPPKEPDHEELENIAEKLRSNL